MPSAASLRRQVTVDTRVKARRDQNEMRDHDFVSALGHTHHRLDDCQANLYHQPEKMLMFAILVDAISCFDKLSPVAGMSRNRRFTETRNWLSSNRRDWPFSYLNICEALGLDPNYLRRGLLGRIQTPRPHFHGGKANGLRFKKSYHYGFSGRL